MGFPGISDLEIAMCTRTAAFPRSQVHKKVKVRPPAGPEAPGKTVPASYGSKMLCLSEWTSVMCYFYLFFTSIFTQIRWDHSHTPVIVRKFGLQEWQSKKLRCRPHFNGSLAGHWLTRDTNGSKRVLKLTLWLFNVAMENGPFIDGLPIKSGDFPWLC